MSEPKSGLDQFRDMLPTLTDEKQKAEWLSWAIDQDTEDHSLPTDEVGFVRSLTGSECPSVRAAAIGYFAVSGPVTWDDLAEWLSDPAEEVREQVLHAMGFASEAAIALCESDIDRAIDVVVSSIKRYPLTEGNLWLGKTAERDEDTFEKVWQAAESVFDCENVDAIASVVVGFFEDVIPARNWGPEDPHIRPWIEGGEWNRKTALLNIGGYLHMRYGRMREIVEALSRDPIPEIAASARRVLSENPVEKPEPKIKHKWKQPKKDR